MAHPSDVSGPGTGEATGSTAVHVASYVLIVDDEEVVREFLARCLESWGYEVKQAGSAAEALELMVDRPASIVLCDIKMPGQDGLWLAERIRAHWPHTAIVMASAIDDLQTVTQSRQLGVADYIGKPIKPDQLRQVIRRVTPPAADEASIPEADESRHQELPQTQDAKIDAEYTLECPVRCAACGERIATVKAVRLIRAQVNFTSTLPRRGRVIVCPHCLAVIPAELTNF